MTMQAQVVPSPFDSSPLGSVCLDQRSYDPCSTVDGGERRIPVTIVIASSAAEKEPLIERILDVYSQSFFVSVVRQGLPRGSLKNDLEFLHAKLTSPLSSRSRQANPTDKSPLFKCLKSRKKHAVIISLHSMADPLPIMQVFFQEDSFQLKFRLNAIVAVVDCHKIAQGLGNSSRISNGTYTNPMQHLQTSIADRIFLHNELPICAEQEAIERHVRGIYPIPLLRLPPYSDGSTNLLELDLSDLDHLDVELKRRGQNDGNLEFPLPRPSLLQGSWRISFQHAGDLSMHLCSRWLEKLFLAHDIIRYQGVFSVKGKHEKYIFHGVHGGFWSGGFSSSRWNHQQRINQFLAVVIPSTSTDRRRELQQTLKACLATKLRFAVGEVVQVMIAKKWHVGRIAGLWDEGNPYCVQLKSDGRHVLVPNDEDCFVRKRPKHLNSKKLKTRPRS